MWPEGETSSTGARFRLSPTAFIASPTRRPHRLTSVSSKRASSRAEGTVRSDFTLFPVRGAAFHVHRNERGDLRAHPGGVDLLLGLGDVLERVAHEEDAA